MHIACAFSTTDESFAWAQALQQALGAAAQVTAWMPGDTPSDIAVVWKPPPLFFEGQPKLKGIFAAGAGVDGLLRLPLPAGVPLVRLEDAGMGAQMATYVSYGVLRFFREFDRYEQQARQGQWQPRPAQTTRDWPVGLLGYGVLGQPVATALQALGFHVHAWVRTAKPNASVPVHVGDASLVAFLRATRVLVCMLPLTPETKHVVRAATLQQLLPGACLINVARGGHVHEADLLQALDAGQLHAALLDVCDLEPAPPTSPLWTHPRVTLTPHIAASTLRNEAVQQIAGKVLALLRGEAVSGAVKVHGY